MNSEPTQVLDELRQICSQYAKEVPSRRRAWPESVKSRVLRLRFLGMSNHRIAQETGIPVMTLYSWKMPEPEKARLLAPEQEISGLPEGFLPVRVVKRRTGLVPRGRDNKHKTNQILTVKSAASRASPPTVTVILPNGLRLEGLSPEQAIEAARKLSQ